MRTIIIFLIFAGFFADSFADPIYDTTKVAGWQVLVPETEPAGWNIPFNMADSSWLSVQMTDIPSPLNPDPNNQHSIMFTAGQVNGSYYNKYFFFRTHDDTFELHPYFDGTVKLEAEMKSYNSDDPTLTIHMGFVKNGSFYFQGPPVTTANVFPSWDIITFWPLQDGNGNNPPQINGRVEVNNIIIVITAVPYTATSKVLVDNIRHRGTLLDPMGDVIVGIDQQAAIPTVFDMKQNYPNPFNPATAIKYQLPTTEDVKLDIYNVLGQKVKTLLNQKVVAGYHEVIWDGRNEFGSKVASGLYIYRIKAGDFVKTRKMILIK